MESVALKAAMLMPLLLLQKPHITSKSKEHVQCLERRLKQWKEGDINGLVREGQTIQQRLSWRSNKNHKNEEMREARQARSFARLMMEGKVHAALCMLSDHCPTSVFDLDNKIDGVAVREILKSKHPQAQRASPSTLLPCNDSELVSHPVLFERITGDFIRSIALQVQGAAGPSAVDAMGWHRMCTAFHGASKELCNALAALT